MKPVLFNKHSTHCYTFISVVYVHAVFLPGDGGFWVSAWRLALHHRWFSGSHHDIAGVLPEFITENCRKREKEIYKKIKSLISYRFVAAKKGRFISVSI